MKFYLQEKQGWLLELDNNIFKPKGLSFCVDGVEQILGVDIDYDKHYVLDVRFKNPKKTGFKKIFLVWASSFCKFDIDYSGLFLTWEADQIVRRLFPDFRIEPVVLWARIIPN